MKFNLLTKFTVVSFGLMVLIAVALAWGIQQQLEQNALRQAAESVASEITHVLNPNLEQADLTAPLDPERYVRIDALIQQQIVREHIVRVKIWSADGLLLYSDEKDLIGQRFPVSDELAEALDGDVAMEISNLDKAENMYERQRFGQRLMEVYAPLRPMGAKQVLGAYEIYHDLVVLEPYLADMRRFVWSSIALGFAVLYGSLFTLVRNASRELMARNAENARLFTEAHGRLERVQMLHAVDMAMANSLDVRFTFNMLVDQVTAHLGIHAVDIWLFHPHDQTLEYVAGDGFRSPRKQTSGLPQGECLAGSTAVGRRIIRMDDLATHAARLECAPWLENEGFVVYYGVPLITKGELTGVLELFQRQPLEPNAEWLEFLETLASQMAIALDNAALFENLQRSNLELVQAYDTTLEGWSHALDLRDKETEGHTLRVTEMTVCLARAMGFRETELVHVRRGALLHDIGKMGIPDSILLKPGPLTDDEWRVMRKHPLYAYDMLAPIAFLRPALDIPFGHHEKWDGSGYPRGLKGEQIPFTARLFAVVDVWDALCSDRPYRKAWPLKKVYQHIRSQTGIHFDPNVVAAFLHIVQAPIDDTDSLDSSAAFIHHELSALSVAD